MKYLFEKKAVKIYAVFVCAMMVIQNLIALLALSAIEIAEERGLHQDWNLLSAQSKKNVYKLEKNG